MTREEAHAILERSRALWNRTGLNLESDEVLSQILDRGSMDDWRALFRLARESGSLRKQIIAVIHRVPLPLPHFWLAALASLGEAVAWEAPVPRYDEHTP